MDRVAFTRNTLRDFVSHFAFGIIDNNIIICHQKGVGNFTFCRETFARAGSAQNQAIRVFQLFAVHHDEVVGKRIQAVVQRFFSALVQFLRGKGDEDSRAAGGQSPLNFDLAVCQRQRGHKPLLLLEVQPPQKAVVGLHDARHGKQVVFKLLPGVGRVYHKEGEQEKALVPALQVGQHSRRVLAVRYEVRGKDVHVVARPHGFFLVE